MSAKGTKRKWAVLLTAAIMLGTLGCSNTSTSQDSNEEKATAKSESATTKKDDSKEPVSKEVTINEQVLVDWEGLKVTATGLEKTEYGDGMELKLLTENNTSGGINLELSKLFVNGAYANNAMNASSNSEIPAGKKAKDSVMLEDLEEWLGGEKIGSIELEFIVRDSSKDPYDDTSIIYTSDLATIQTSAYDEVDTKAIAEGTELYSQNGIRIVVKELTGSGNYMYELLLYLENTTEKDIFLECYDATADGFVIEQPLLSGLVPAGRCSIEPMHFYYDENVPDEAALKEVKEIQFGVKVYDRSQYNRYSDSGLLIDTGMLTYEP